LLLTSWTGGLWSPKVQMERYCKRRAYESDPVLMIMSPAQLQHWPSAVQREKE